MDSSNTPTIVWGTKGFAQKTGELLSHVAEHVLGDTAVTAAISGPSFAYEVVRGIPAGFDLASTSSERIESIADLFRSEFILVYTTSDIIGVQVGGATKNVIAIAAGISDGLGFGINARALLITRGLAEMNRLNVALGGRPETMMGLSGLGDLVLTCSGDLSRNRRLGLGLGQGKPIDEIVEEIGQEVEGIQSTRETYQIGKKMDVFMPTTERMYRILYEGLSPLQAAAELMAIGPSIK
jgi:glycerol-3-phosphate dehydrogenase (NAD(P)+)